MDSILITGGAGFIGSHLAAHLAQVGQRVVVVDNFDPYYDPAVKRAVDSMPKAAQLLSDAKKMIAQRKAAAEDQ